AHKGAIRWRMSTAGRSCHSSRPDQGLNAIYRMGHLLAGIERFAAYLQGSCTDPLLGPPTLSVGRIEGGTSVNTVPDRCTIEVDRRVIPGEDPFEAPAQLMNYLHTESGIHFPFECEEPWMRLPALGPELSADLVEQLRRVITTERTE